MSLTIAVTPGYVFQDDDILTPAILRSIAQPTIQLNGGIGTASLTDNSVTTPILADGCLAATTLGQGKMATGFLLLSHIGTGIFTANSAGWAPFAEGWLPLSLVGDGIFTPTPAGRAPFADGLINAALSQMDAFFYGTGGGTGSAYTVTVSPTLASYVNGSGGQAFTNYWDGLVLAFKAPASSNAAATLAEASLDIVKPIYRMDGTAIQANDILSGAIVEVRYNASMGSGAGGWQMMTPPTPQPTYYRAGTFTCVGQTALTVAFSSAVPNTNYIVTTSTGASAAGIIITAKTVNGFTATQTSGVGSTNTFSYIAMPQF